MNTPDRFDPSTSAPAPGAGAFIAPLITTTTQKG